ncbi:hypothetical protein IJ182_09920 [bacterium]|nr:hypothetical protein [bacterium]
MDFFNKIKNIFIKNKSKKTEFYNFSTTKCSMSSACTLKFSAATEEKKKEINTDLKKLIKKYINNPEKLIRYLQFKGIKIYKIKNANKILQKLGEEEGFLTPLKGYKAFIINLLISIFGNENFKISFSSKEMFIFNEGETEIYTIARALHKYYGFKNNLPGFDYASQEIFKRIYGKVHKNQTSPLSSCSSLKDIYACKEALARDLESINFTIELSVEYERAKKALNILKETNSTNI